VFVLVCLKLVVSTTFLLLQQDIFNIIYLMVCLADIRKCCSICYKKLLRFKFDITRSCCFFPLKYNSGFLFVIISAKIYFSKRKTNCVKKIYFFLVELKKFYFMKYKEQFENIYTYTQYKNQRCNQIRNSYHIIPV